jgi:hypothetical protein
MDSMPETYHRRYAPPLPATYIVATEDTIRHAELDLDFK